jgi:uncharacterized membrane protein
MGLTWTAPAALWLLAALPIVWAAPLVARTTFNRRQRWLQAAVRSLLLAALAAALARPIVSMSSAQQSIVYVVDVSHSVSSQAIEAAARTIDAMNAARHPDHWRIVAFGMNAAAIDSTAALRQLAQIDPTQSDSGAVDRDGTDLEAALDAARGELRAGAVPRLVLFSDGRATGGDARAAIARLAAAHIPVSVEPLAVRSLGDVWIDAFGVPDRIAAGGTFTVTIAVGAQRAGPATVELRSGARVLASLPVALSSGVNHVALETSIGAPGAHVLQAAVTAAGDPLDVNDTLDRGVWIHPRPKVLYVEGAAASARYLAGALGQSGFDVAVRRPADLPASAAGLDPWDLVVLSDVSRAAIPGPSMAALAAWVEESGGGLLVAGGESVFGEAGYRNTALERLTPVTFERRDEPEVALILVLDRSWSMAGGSMELCKTAAQAAVDVMRDEQAVGILSFSDRVFWDVTVRNVGRNREDIRRRIAAIEPDGHTLIFPAIEQAYLALRSTQARAKHVLLLSDGRSLPADYEGLVRTMVAARMTVSSVAVGPAADPELLGNIAKWGKGRAYAVQDPREVPQIFVKEAKTAATPAFDEKDIRPVVKTPAFLRGLDLTNVPRLKGRTATVLKETALEVMSTDDEDPLLAFWQIGLGRTAVFASDVKDRWASDWIRWRGYAPFFAAIARALERQRPPSVALDVVPGPRRGNAQSMAISIEARAADGRYRDLLRPVVRIRSGEGTAADVPARQVAPGRYEATVIADATKTLTVTMAGPAGAATGITSAGVIPDAAAEYRFRPPDEVLLQSIAAATGGIWRPSAATVRQGIDRRTQRRPAWPALVALALCLWFVDLLLRRVRVFEPRVQTHNVAA